MAFSPTLPSSGLGGWRFLQATLDTQTDVFSKSPNLKRLTAYFNDTIKDGMSLEDFMGDRQLLTVALGAYGLNEEVDKRAYVRKMLEEGTTERSAFAVRLNNPQYLEFAKAFNFENGTLKLSENISTITQKFFDEQFEAELGNVDNSMRLALNFKRDIADLASEDYGEETAWFKVMGSLPLRAVFEGAFNLPTEFSQLDIDRQKEIFADKSERLLGTRDLSALKTPDNVEKVISRFLLREQINAGPSASTPGYSALTLLQGGLGSNGIANLIATL